MPRSTRRLYTRETILRQSFIMDDFLYKTSQSVREYQNPNTLDRRIVKLANRMRNMKVKHLFVSFDLTLRG